MKICFCGLGSIGKRHLENLQIIANDLNLKLEIHALRKTGGVLESRISSLVSKQLFNECELDSDYDIVFVTNPTSMHYDTVRIMAGKTRHMFIEKPIFDGREFAVETLMLNENGVFYVAGPLRFSPVILKLGEIIQKERVYCVRTICSSYLPDWRPNSDYRTCYSARKDMGGGVALDLIHEWDYITHLFGLPLKVCSMIGKYSHLETDSEDLALYIADYGDKLVELHLDCFGRIPMRRMEIFTENATVVGDLIHNTISFSDGRERLVFHESKNDIYLKEMKFFMLNILSNNSFNNIARCNAVLKIALGKEST